MLHLNIIGIIMFVILSWFWFRCAKKRRSKFFKGCFRFFGSYNVLMALLLLGATLMA